MPLFSLAHPRRVFPPALLPILAGVTLLAAWAALWLVHPVARATSLASFTENQVRVEIILDHRADGAAMLTAVFTPLEAGFHLYGKNLPRLGQDGLGRPTLLELAPGSRMIQVGELVESPAEVMENAASGAPGLVVYPPGPVTLSLAVAPPARSGEWLEDAVTVTYMACSPAGICHAPVSGRIVAFGVPVELMTQAAGETGLPRPEAAPTKAVPTPRADSGDGQGGPGFSLVRRGRTSNEDLTAVLAAEAARARELGQRPFVLFSAGWCYSCRQLETSFKESLVRQALAGVYLVRLDLDEWKLALGESGFEVSGLPVIFCLADSGYPQGQSLGGSALPEGPPGVLADVLYRYFNKSMKDSPAAAAPALNLTGGK